MAESAILKVISSVGGKLTDLILQTVVLCCSVDRRVEEMKSELEVIHSTLEEADAIHAKAKDAVFQKWKSELREVAYDLDDSIDSFSIQEKLQEEQSFSKRCAFIYKKWAYQYNTSNEILAIQSKIKKIDEERKKYNIGNVSKGEGSNSTEEYTRRWRQVLPNTKEGDFVGLKKSTTALVGELLKQEETQLRVVSIVGMPGSGKTTLAKHVYIRDDIKSHFDCCAWADVSKDHNVKSVMLRLLRELKVLQEDKGQELEEVVLMQKLYIFLEKKRYLVVLDDVWMQKAWDDLKNAFPDGKIGSKVMLTSRNQILAAHADPRSHPIVTEMLTEDQSWALFCKKAFRGENCPEDMQRCGREMVGKCGGLPLAIVVLGGLLSSKTTQHEWEKVYRNINWHISKEEQLSSIMGLSYNALSYHLKLCFLHLSLFPEDYRIKTRRLIGLWIAEGFVQEEGNETLEDVAENYLQELISRCMVQVADMSSIGRVKACRVHDVLRDFSLEKAKDDAFCLILENNSNVADSLKNSRRLAIHSEKDYDDLEKFAPLSTRCHRSLLLFNRKPIEEYLEFICKNFKLLRVLDLEGLGSIHVFPEEIGNLVHLRYLGLRRTAIKCKVPSSISNLRMLETLDLFDNNYSARSFEMSDVIWKLENLRCLFFPYYGKTSQIRIDNLKKLHSLIEIEAGSWMNSFSNFTNLVKLGIRGKSREDMNKILDFLAKLNYLQILFLRLESGETFPSLAPLGNCHQLLKLQLTGKIEVLPNPHEFPPKLTSLNFFFSRFEQDPMPTLEKLPSLANLGFLQGSYMAKTMVCTAKGFPRLQCLKVRDADELKEWIVEKGAMPSLQHLELYRSRRLRMVPEGLRFITTLQELQIGDSPSWFRRRVAEGGKDWHKIQHIPSIRRYSSLVPGPDGALIPFNTEAFSEPDED